MSGLKYLYCISIDPSRTRITLGCSVTHLALAWVARNPNTGTVILGASRPDQVLDNLKVLKVITKLAPEILDKIEAMLENKAPPQVPSLAFQRVNYPIKSMSIKRTLGVHLSTCWASCEPKSGANDDNAIGTGGERTRYQSTLPRTL